MSPLEGFEELRNLLVEQGCCILRALVEFADTQCLGRVLFAAVQLHRSLLTGAGWHDSSTSQFRQFGGVGAHYTGRLSDASGGSLLAFS